MNPRDLLHLFQTAEIQLLRAENLRLRDLLEKQTAARIAAEESHERLTSRVIAGMVD